MQRRVFLGTALGGIIAGLSAPVLAGSSKGTRAASNGRDAHPTDRIAARAKAIEAELASIERSVDGRLGVALLDMETGMRAGHRVGERFPICSTFKLMLAANVLARVDRGEENLERRIVFGQDRIDQYAPVTRERTGAPGMTIAELCDAIVTMSDNTAANLLLDTVGGSAGFTAFMRRLGDTVTRLDRNEPSLNEAIPGDPRDTTTPIAMLNDLREVLLGDALTAASRARLLAWGVGNRTGDTRLRAGVPGNWRVADKTGTGERGTTNDVGLLWPQERQPIVVTVYLTQSPAPVRAREAALADVARAIVRNVA
ncbi:class A beta-lactamase [Trinickia soli]|uniref:Beta-lactamase n=1 Tax=Trinickia soli TaxID=380675 RepID=A0A2N7WGH8_9BURK|nr:class A beta-lactamase [Trinickia soli]PMS28576.1 class A beta-lactamase [Trinickia soli]CAB3669329.1 Beta-lactamase [Trinickia soli]